MSVACEYVGAIIYTFLFVTLGINCNNSLTATIAADAAKKDFPHPREHTATALRQIFLMNKSANISDCPLWSTMLGIKTSL
jgi:hypothetical protein